MKTFKIAHLYYDLMNLYGENGNIRYLKNRLEEQDIFLTFTDKAEKYLCNEGFDQEYGARPLRRTITKKVEDMLSEEILLGNVVKGNAIIIAEENDKLVINKK